MQSEETQEKRRLRGRTLLVIAILLGGVYLIVARPGWLFQSLPGLSLPGSTRTPTHRAPVETASPPVASRTPFEVSPTRAPATTTPSSTPLPSPSATSPASPTLIPSLPAFAQDFPSGPIALSIREGNHSHLFLYHPQLFPLTRITFGDWDDITPAFSPDGSQLAFASNRDGQWDLYLLDLPTGAVSRLTDTPAYDASPTWSPDGLFLAYESYQNDNLDLFIRGLNKEMDPIQLTTDPGADYSPAWSPGGREIAFISTRGGKPEVWVADLDQTEGRFQPAHPPGNGVEAHPAWEGASLAWASIKKGIHNLSLARPDAPGAIQTPGDGDWPVWSPDGQVLLTTLTTPNQTYLTGYRAGPGKLVALPPILLPGPVEGLDWGASSLPSKLPASLQEAARGEPTNTWLPAVTPAASNPFGRVQLIPLEDVEAPDPRLHDFVDESFSALRRQVAAETGWDFLATLENAFVSLTAPLPPGLGEDWLYTGRAIAINPAPINAGWLKVVREDFGLQTFWRVYLRTRFQDGSQGRPMAALPWDLEARFDSNPQVYEQGGAFEAEIPAGYWVDFTALAAAYGWERLPALLIWRTFYQGARFNEFVLRMGLDWKAAILEIYPPEVLITPQPVPSGTLEATASPTPSPTPTKTPAPTRTSSPTPAPTTP